jgi:hypothetical protein
MTFLILFLGVSVFSAILVIAAGMLSSRTNRHAETVEKYPSRQTVERVPKELSEALD